MKIELAGAQQRLVAEGSEQVIHLQNPKTTARVQPVQAVVIHYTAVRAASRPPKHLEAFRKLIGPEYDVVAAFAKQRGAVPGALMLSLNNASNLVREASWDFTVGQSGLVVQCNLELSARFSWHAGRSLEGDNGYIARHGSHSLLDYRGALVYDGVRKRFAGPRLPNGEVMQSGNPPTIGIEIENWGRVDQHKGLIGRFDKQSFHPIPGLERADLVEIGGKLYERIPQAQYDALVEVCRALRDFFAIPENGWFGHRQITPDSRVDPDPPLDLERLIHDVYADRVQVVVAADGDDPEQVFLGEPLPNNAVG